MQSQESISAESIAAPTNGAEGNGCAPPMADRARPKQWSPPKVVESLSEQTAPEDLAISFLRRFHPATLWALTSFGPGKTAAQPKSCRVCKGCEHTKPVELFKKSGNGFGHICKACDAARASARWHADPEASRAKRRARRQRNLDKERAQAQERYWSNPEKHRAAARERARSERGRASNRKAVARYRRTHPEIVAAQRLAQRAARRGELKVALVCQVKGCRETTGLHLHHVDYRKPKDTIRICRREHEHVHHIGPLELKPGAGRKWVRAPRTEHGRAANVSC